MEMAVKFPGGKLVTSNYNGFEVTTDLPKSEGGEGTAPSPYALFLASMGNCAGIYVLYFCQSRHISTDGVSLALSFDFDKKTYLATKIDINVKLPEDFHFIDLMHGHAERIPVEGFFFGVRVLFDLVARLCVQS